MSVPSPFATDPFQPLGSLCNERSFLHLYQDVSVIYSMWYVKVRLAHVFFQKDSAGGSKR